MSSTSFDVLIIGAGPAGCSAAIELVQRGFRVALIEKSIFPRHRIGESLPPKVMSALQILGVATTVQRAGFASMTGTAVYQAGQMISHGLGNSGQGNGLQVDRALFDQILLARAQALGCTLYVGRPVSKVEIDQSHCRLWTEDKVFESRWLVDASGTRSIVGRALGVNRKARHRTLALCAYWRSCRLPEDVPATHTLFEMLPDAWVWSVLRSDGLRNVTLGIDPDEFEGDAQDLKTLYQERLAESELVGPLIDKANLESELLSYESTCFHSDSYLGDAYILVGDAASFIDPLTSQGVYKALQSGIMAAAVINTMTKRPEDTVLARTYYQESQEAFVENYAAIAHSMYCASAFAHKPFWLKRMSVVSKQFLSRSDPNNAFLDAVRTHGGHRVCLKADFSRISILLKGRASGGFIVRSPVLVDDQGQTLDLLDIDVSCFFPLLDGRSMSDLFEAYAIARREDRSNALGKCLLDALGKMSQRGWLSHHVIINR